MNKKLLVLGVSLFAFVPVAVADNLPDGPHVYVEGAAELDVEPDRLVLTVNISSTHLEVKTAKSDVDRRSIDLIKTCKEIGVEVADISSASLSLRPSYRYANDTRVFEGTRVERNIEINLRDLSRYSDLMRAVVDADVAEISSTRLFAAESDELEDRALEAALADASQRAQRLASAAGAKLGDVYSITEFRIRHDVWQLHSGRYTTAGTAPRSAAEMAISSVSAGGEVFSPGLLKAHAEAFVVFTLKP